MCNRALSCCTVVMLALAIGSAVHAQDNGGLHFLATTNEYYGVEYVPSPVAPARDVVFAGEPVVLRLEVGNANFTPETLSTSGRSIREAFSLEVIRAPQGASIPTLTVEANGRIVGQVGSDVTWGDDIDVPPRSRVTFRGVIATSRAAIPGVYEVRISPNLRTSSTLNRLGLVVRYEIRLAATFADEVEVMRRYMMREYYHENTAAAEAACEALLDKYPQSAAAYRIKGDLAASKGDRKGAIEALSKARQLLADGQDELWRAQGSRDGYRAVEDLTQQIHSLATGAPVRGH